MDYKIRKADPCDAKAIAKVHVQSWKETYKGIIPNDYLESLSEEERSKMWERILSRGEDVWVALNNFDEIIGFCNGGKAREPEKGFEGELYAIYLLKEFQKKNIGKKLFNSLVQKFKSDGIKSMYLWVIEESPTCRIYEALGGVKTDLKKSEMIGNKKIEEVAYSFNLI